jgi:hypothetical protein
MRFVTDAGENVAHHRRVVTDHFHPPYKGKSQGTPPVYSPEWGRDRHQCPFSIVWLSSPSKGGAL